MTSQSVLSVGQCRPDQAAIAHFLTSNFGVRVLNADFAGDAFDVLRQHPVDLVLINRRLDADGSDGMELLQMIREDGTLGQPPVMLVSNYPEWQQRAQDLGALPGFGKAELRSAAARERVAAALQGPVRSE